MKNAFISLVLLSMLSCSQRFSLTPDKADHQTYLSFAKGACFGQCPVFEITFLQNGDFIYESKRFQNEIGVFQGTSSSELKNLVQKQRSMLEKGNYQDYYEAQIPDLAGSSYIYDQKKISFKDQAPQELVGGADAMMAMIKKIEFDRSIYTSKKEYLDGETLVFTVKEGCSLDREFQEFWSPLSSKISPLTNNIKVYEMELELHMIGIGRAYSLLNQSTCIESVEIKEKS